MTQRIYYSNIPNDVRDLSDQELNLYDWSGSLSLNQPDKNLIIIHQSSYTTPAWSRQVYIPTPLVVSGGLSISCCRQATTLLLVTLWIQTTFEVGFNEVAEKVITAIRARSSELPLQWHELEWQRTLLATLIDDCLVAHSAFLIILHGFAAAVQSNERPQQRQHKIVSTAHNKQLIGWAPYRA